MDVRECDQKGQKTETKQNEIPVLWPAPQHFWVPSEAYPDTPVVDRGDSDPQTFTRIAMSA